MNEDVFVKFIVQSAKRHPRVIDLNRGKTLAFKRQCPLYEFFFLTVLIQQSADPDQFGRSVTAVMYSSNKLNQSQRRVTDIH